MNNREIGQAVTSVEQCLASQPDPGPRADTPARATMVDGLRCRIESPDGKAIYTDMPAEVGGEGTANSPGWHLRAALASCDATLLAMRAARQGLQLDGIEVSVEASSDGRGMFLDQGVSPGSTGMHLRFKIAPGNASAAEIESLVRWVEAHSPVATDVSRAVELSSDIEIA